MKREIPVLTITVQVPLVPGIDVEQVLQALTDTVTEALEQIRDGERPEATEPEATEPADEEETLRAPTVSEETLEPYSQETRTNLLAALGYTDGS